MPMSFLGPSLLMAYQLFHVQLDLVPIQNQEVLSRQTTPSRTKEPRNAEEVKVMHQEKKTLLGSKHDVDWACDYFSKHMIQLFIFNLTKAAKKNIGIILMIKVDFGINF